MQPIKPVSKPDLEHDGDAPCSIAEALRRLTGDAAEGAPPGTTDDADAGDAEGGDADTGGDRSRGEDRE